jgi:protocatechuate 3,4-dioxygenase, beta subunit
MTKLFLLPALLFFFSCDAQTKKVSGDVRAVNCEGCEAIYENDVPFAELSPELTLSDWNNGEGKQLEVSGVVYEADGKTPAADVILYIYHTDHTGVYPVRGDEKGWARRHGYLRGWMKTNKRGEYKFLTRRPASYPNSSNPAHIHLIVKKQGAAEFYADDYVFRDDPYLKRALNGNPQAEGILEPVESGGILRAKRDVVLPN